MLPLFVINLSRHVLAAASTDCAVAAQVGSFLAPKTAGVGNLAVALISAAAGTALCP